MNAPWAAPPDRWASAGARRAQVIAALLALVAAVPSAAGDEARVVSVRDIIQTIRITEPDIQRRRLQALKWATSPSGRRLVYVTSDADLAANRLIYRLLHHDMLAELAAQRRAKADFASAEVLVELSSSGKHLFEHAIRDVSWLDEDTVTFLAEENDSATQAYAFHLPERRLTPLTNHSRPVLSFAYDAKRQRTIYQSTVYEPSYHYDDTTPAYVVGSGSLGAVLYPECDSCGRPLRAQFYVQEAPVRAEWTRARPISGVYSTAQLSRVRLSPDGRRALVRTSVQDQEKLLRWAKEYGAIRAVPFWEGKIRSYDPYFMQKELYEVHQFAVIDLAEAKTEAVFDAPDGMAVGGYAVDAAWMPDGKSVILANTLLPLEGTTHSERDRRRSAAAIVEYDLERRLIHRIADLRPNDKDSSFTGIELAGSDALEIHWAGGARSAFKKQHGNWTAGALTRSSAPLKSAASQLRIYVLQDMNSPSRVVVRDTRSGAEATLLDLGARLNGLALGRLEEFEWTGKDGHVWRSGLLFPPGYTPGTRLPLVIQMNGFDRSEFLLDGPYGYRSAFAAQALAGRGMLVLQLAHFAFAGESHSQRTLARYQAGIERAIDLLDERGLLDRTRVGIIGFSATGNVARHMITFSDYDIAAATIADAWSFTLFGYVAYLYGFAHPGMITAEGVTDAVPWGDTLATWVARDPSLHTDRVNAALRLEQYGIYVYPFWDLYALLRRQHKPAELIVFPNGHHQLRQPRQRELSLQGNVDWFAFWLKGEEDHDPAKAAQYARWRQMRSLREAAQTGAQKVSPPGPG